MINRQKHWGSCGVVAIKNALEFKGKRINYNDVLDYAKRRLGFKFDNGMYTREIRTALKRFRIQHKNIVHPTFVDIHRELKLGRGIILLYRWYQDRKNAGHFIFIDRETPKHFRAWNHCRERSNMCKKTDLANDLRYSHRHHGNDYSFAIVII